MLAAQAAQVAARRARNPCGNRRRERRERERKQHHSYRGREPALTNKPARKADGGAPVNPARKRLL
ncbi:MAG: hypothetical protein DMG58_29205 [Acidobacteria bacterium]|nr:MAG: hypothetical protein DMG58_29205 [Acidobacteriota bacterium]